MEPTISELFLLLRSRLPGNTGLLVTDLLTEIERRVFEEIERLEDEARWAAMGEDL